MHRAKVAAVVLMLLLLISASAAPYAAAHTATSSVEFVVEIDEVQPSVDGLDVSADSDRSEFKVAAPGLDVVVLGYEQEPYLWMDRQGHVWENRNSRSFWLNADPDSPRAPPSAQGPVEWSETSARDVLQWHDHRIHYMSPRLPELTSATQVLMEWELRLMVDQQEVEVTGRLLATRVERTTSLPPALLPALFVVVCAVFLWFKKPSQLAG